MKPAKLLNSYTQAVTGLLFVGLSSQAFGDYQQTLAARGADAFTPTSTVATIEPKDIARVFSLDAEEGNRALTDQDVMVDLQKRMNSERQLEKAAQSLDPAAAAELAAIRENRSPEEKAPAETAPLVESDNKADQKAKVAAR